MGRSLRQLLRVERKQYEIAKSKGERRGGEGGGRAKGKWSTGMKHTHSFVHTLVWISHLNNAFYPPRDAHWGSRKLSSSRKAFSKSGGRLSHSVTTEDRELTRNK